MRPFQFSNFFLPLLLPLPLLLLSLPSFSQSKEKKIPAVELKTPDGKTFNTSAISNNGKPIIINFWATWCAPCKKELNAIAELYDDWQKETGVKLVAVSIDDSRTSGNVLPYVKSKGWEYEVLVDVNSDFKRALNVNNPPHTFVVDGNGEIVWEHVGYSEGSENNLFEAVQKVAKGEKIEKQ